MKRDLSNRTLFQSASKVCILSEGTIGRVMPGVFVQQREH